MPVFFWFPSFRPFAEMALVTTGGESGPPVISQLPGGQMVIPNAGVQTAFFTPTADDTFFKHAVTFFDWQHAAMSDLEERERPQDPIWVQQEVVDRAMENLVQQIAVKAKQEPASFPGLAVKMAESLNITGAFIFNKHISELLTNFYGSIVKDFVPLVGTEKMINDWNAVINPTIPPGGAFSWNNLNQEQALQIVDKGAFFVTLFRKRLDLTVAVEFRTQPTEPLTNFDIQQLDTYIIADHATITALANSFKTKYDEFESNYRRMLAQAQMLWWTTFCFGVKIGLHYFPGVMDRLAEIVATRHVLARAASLPSQTMVMLSQINWEDLHTKGLFLLLLDKTPDYFGVPLPGFLSDGQPISQEQQLQHKLQRYEHLKSYLNAIGNNPDMKNSEHGILLLQSWINRISNVKYEFRKPPTHALAAIQTQQPVPMIESEIRPVQKDISSAIAFPTSMSTRSASPAPSPPAVNPAAAQAVPQPLPPAPAVKPAAAPAAISPSSPSGQSVMVHRAPVAKKPGNF